MDRKQLESDKKVFKDIDGVKAVLLYGSRVEGREHEKSDWDICLVAPERNSWEVIKDTWHNEETRRDSYDVHTFEELPLKIKKRIIDNHEVIWKDDGFYLEEYLQKFRRIWGDQAMNRGVA